MNDFMEQLWKKKEKEYVVTAEGVNASKEKMARYIANVKQTITISDMYPALRIGATDGERKRNGNE